ncbi:glycosyl hydrolase [Ideonella sp. B508-1]|uniref:glycosyl hydrolase n=1 Tax=Ideonella sp. B508-1 TaxID=137716 RepID=UPI00034B586B|nr:glycosyl hydrolase [Ideonella sp. B508-1]
MHAAKPASWPRRLLLCAVLPATVCLAAEAPPRPVGAGFVQQAFSEGGLLSKGDARPPVPTYRTAEMTGRAAPSNTWFSSLVYERWSHPLYAHPLSYRASELGFEIGRPDPRFESGPTGVASVNWLHQPLLVVAPEAFQPDDARLEGHGDWDVQIDMAHGAQHMRATIAHGSPISHYRFSEGGARIDFRADVQTLPDSDATRLHLRVGGKAWGVFLPTGAKAQWTTPTRLSLSLPEGGRWLAVAALPDDSKQSFEAFASHAATRITGTRVSYVYDAAASEVRTHYELQTETLQGPPRPPLVGLYPHQRLRAAGLQLPWAYPSVRGEIRVGALQSFDTVTPYVGIVPLWPALGDAQAADRLNSLLRGDVARTPESLEKQGAGTYWVGKFLGRAAQLLAIAQVQGRQEQADRLAALMTEQMRRYFRAEGGTRHFVDDATTGSLLGYPDEFGSVAHMNDHHFHYGYWLQALSMLALRDPALASDSQWGGIAKLLVRDIATDERGRADAPFLRNFDPYEGHSWASGDADMDAGNNQESSSEAMNAWAALIYWGEITGNRRLTELGIALYSTESDAIASYWYDCHRQVFDPRFDRAVAAQVFGGRYAYDTWWTQNPREVQGINILPLTPASTYLSAGCPAGGASFLEALRQREAQYRAAGPGDGTPRDVWQDIFAGYLALWDAPTALAQWDDRGDVEQGESRSHMWFWLNTLRSLGPRDTRVHADVPLHAVFAQADGARRYLAVNAGSNLVTAHFSDGRQMNLPAHSLVTLTIAPDGTSRTDTTSLLR